jgi:hypothetical protein
MFVNDMHAVNLEVEPQMEYRADNLVTSEDLNQNWALEYPMAFQNRHRS